MKTSFSIAFFIIFFQSSLFAGDWPTWRYDSERSAATPDGLAENLSPLWSREIPKVRPAWPLDPQKRVDFDASYEPVVMGKLMILGSQNDGTITAYDTETGEEKWKFFTEGPVRCAPACWKDKVFAGSDDGYLYCLNVSDGTLIWKFRGAPKDRPDRRHIGNGHLISFWPVRGGPVVKDGTVCFGCGVWSIFGVFIYGLDAETGKVKWENPNLNYISHVRIDHELFADEGLSPQGYLVAVRDRLLVPSGRSLPAGLKFDTGELIYYVRGFHSGDSRVTSSGELAFVGKQAVINTFDFREIGSKWSYSGSKPPKGYKKGFGMNHVGNPDKNCMGEAPWIPYKYVQACDASSALDNGMAYGIQKGNIFAYDIKNAKNIDTQHVRHRKKIPIWTWTPPLLWELKTGKAQPGRAIIKAGDKLYAGSGKKIYAIGSLKENPKIEWEKNLNGVATSIIAADDKLFAVTNGWIHCFGKADSSRKAIVHDKKALKPELKNDKWTAKADEIFKASGIKSGYCLVLGVENGRLIEEILKNSELHVIAIDDNAKTIDQLRKAPYLSTLLGSRLELLVGKPFEYLFPQYIASLIVSENATKCGFSFKLNPSSIFNLLRPYGGTLCLDLPRDMNSKFKGWTDEIKAENAKIKQVGQLSLLIRDGALPGSAPWTHNTADPARTLCSRDDLVKAPLGILWYGDMNGFKIWKAGPRPQVVGGRVVVPKPHSRSNEIVVYDAYTGRRLWRINIKSKTRGGPVVSMEDAIYLAMDGQCKLLDPKTGKEMKSFKFAESGTMATIDLRINDDFIVIACRNFKEADRKLYKHAADPYDASTIICLDKKNGKELWRKEAKDRFSSTSITLGDNMVFCVDSVPIFSANREKWKHLEGIKNCESTTMAFDARTGKELWTDKKTYVHDNKAPGRPNPAFNDWLAYSTETGVLIGGRRGMGHAWDAKTGKPLWKDKKTGNMPTILMGRSFITYHHRHPHYTAIEYDLLTGEATKRKFKAPKGGCNYTIGGKHLTVARDLSTSYYDIQTGKYYRLRNVRSGCNNGLIQADGILNVPNMATGCLCSYSFFTSFALTKMPEVDKWSGDKPYPMKMPPAKIKSELKVKDAKSPNP